MGLFMIPWVYLLWINSWYHGYGGGIWSTVDELWDKIKGLLAERVTNKKLKSKS